MPTVYNLLNMIVFGMKVERLDLENSLTKI